MIGMTSFTLYSNTKVIEQHIVISIFTSDEVVYRGASTISILNHSCTLSYIQFFHAGLPNSVLHLSAFRTSNLDPANRVPYMTTMLS